MNQTFWEVLFKEFFTSLRNESLMEISNLIDRELQSRKELNARRTNKTIMR